MKFNLTKHLPPKVIAATGRKALIVQRYSPEILFGAGVVGAVTATVLACRSTLKLGEVLDEAEKDKITLENIPVGEGYSQREYDKNLAALKIRTVARVAKLYMPAVLMGSLSIGALTGSHYIMSSRQAGLMAAYAALDKGFKEYQSRVAEEIGEERAGQLRYDNVIHKEKDADGKVIKTVRVNGVTGASIYARFFDKQSAEWVNNPEYNKMTLVAKQEYLNNLLHARGHVFLNEVYDALGIPRTRAGAVVGWFVGKNTKNGNRDSYIDFGLFNGNREAVREFVNGNENAILLDFNVDGPILNLLDED